MDATDKLFIEQYRKSRLYAIVPIKILNDKIYFTWSSARIYSLFLSEVDSISKFWFFGWHTSYVISAYTFMDKAVLVD